MHRSLEELQLQGENSIGSKVSFFMIQQLPELRDGIVNGQDWQEIAEHAI